MCFIIAKGYAIPKIAKKDIICYKLFKHRSGKKVTSEIMGFTYDLGATYIEDSMIVNTNPKVTREGLTTGFHSYSAKSKVSHFLGKTYTGRRVVIECVIPKGALYYHNPSRKEYLSNEITIGKAPITK